MNREENENIVNARIGGRRSSDIDKIDMSKLRIAINRDEFLLLDDESFLEDRLINDFDLKQNNITFSQWYFDGMHYIEEQPLRKLIRLYNRRLVK